mmetsp:Transcript_11499/g.40960  ORF Transcript_11499/g.40960 Transcript_11499/m.40960 type:complete len:415 (-) Transcript_11499:20-1264(-)
MPMFQRLATMLSSPRLLHCLMGSAPAWVAVPEVATPPRRSNCWTRAGSSGSSRTSCCSRRTDASRRPRRRPSWRPGPRRLAVSAAPSRRMPTPRLRKLGTTSPPLPCRRWLLLCHPHRLQRRRCWGGRAGGSGANQLPGPLRHRRHLRPRGSPGGVHRLGSARTAPAAPRRRAHSSQGRAGCLSARSRRHGHGRGRQSIRIAAPTAWRLRCLWRRRRIRWNASCGKAFFRQSRLPKATTAWTTWPMLTRCSRRTCGTSGFSPCTESRTKRWRACTGPSGASWATLPSSSSGTAPRPIASTTSSSAASTAPTAGGTARSSATARTSRPMRPTVYASAGEGRVRDASCCCPRCSWVRARRARRRWSSLPSRTKSRWPGMTRRWTTPSLRAPFACSGITRPCLSTWWSSWPQMYSEP